jgi:hypothetical protein
MHSLLTPRCSLFQLQEVQRTAGCNAMNITSLSVNALEEQRRLGEVKQRQAEFEQRQEKVNQHQLKDNKELRALLKTKIKEMDAWKAEQAKEMDKWKAAWKAEQAKEMDKWKAAWKAEQAKEMDAWKAAWKAEHAKEMDAWKAAWKAEHAEEMDAWKAGQTKAAEVMKTEQVKENGYQKESITESQRANDKISFSDWSKMADERCQQVFDRNIKTRRPCHDCFTILRDSNGKHARCGKHRSKHL